MATIKDQAIKEISVKNLVLWTENPRDPITPDANDQDIVNRALQSKKWKLNILSKEMGSHFDLSELPTVVYENGKPIVYDGNRRIILAKIKLNLVKVNEPQKIKLPDFPTKIPCNVCQKNVAIEHLLRKHGENGSWTAIEREYFLVKFMEYPPSPFYLLEKFTKAISENNNLNKRFVKDEIFTTSNLEKIGVKISEDRLFLKYDLDFLNKILIDLDLKIGNQTISTRSNRGELYSILDNDIKQRIDTCNTSEYKELSSEETPESTDNHNNTQPTPIFKKPRRVKQYRNELFGGTLNIKSGNVGNLYRDICDLYNYFIYKKTHDKPLSNSFSSIIRMALRLLCETAATELKSTLKDYLDHNFDSAKIKLTQDQKTTLSSQNVNKNSIEQLLHIGAHNYSASMNMEQTLAISLIVGKMLLITFGQQTDDAK